MRLRTIAGVALLLLAATTPATAAAQDGASNCQFPVERTDATGTTVTVESEPQRVVTLNPSAAQTLWEMGTRDKVVGVTKHAMNLDGAQAKRNVSGAGETINNEEVVALEPDLVLAPNTVSNDTVSKLRGTGLTIYRFHEAKSIRDIYAKTRLIGELTGECAAAEETVSRMQSRLAVVDEATDGRDRPDAIYEFYGYTAGNETFIHEIVERAGANNVAADAGITGYQQISAEVLVQQDPEWVVLNSDDDQVPDTEAFNGTTAVENDQVVVVDKNHLNRPAPRVVLAVTKLTKAFHPEAYAAANESATRTGTDAASESATGSATESATDSATEASADGEATETPTATGGSGPGFTAIGALLALVCAGVVARVREH